MDSDLILQYQNLIKETCRKVDKVECVTTNEAECRHKLIDPVLEFLGYNIHGADVLYEHGGTARVDYWVRGLACIEAKKLEFESNGYIYDYALCTPQHKEQLFKYLTNHNWQLGVLTNGIKWEFYWKIQGESNTNAWTPFKRINFREIHPTDFEFLECLRKGVFKIEDLPTIYMNVTENIYERRTN